MDPVRNPYAPGAGQRPPELAGRDDELAAFEVVLERVARGRPDRSIVLTGLRGVGKTVLLNATRSAAVRRGWGSGKLEARPDQPLRWPLAAALHVAIRELSGVPHLGEPARPGRAQVVRAGRQHARRPAQGDGGPVGAERPTDGAVATGHRCPGGSRPGRFRRHRDRPGRAPGRRCRARGRIRPRHRAVHRRDAGCRPAGRIRAVRGLPRTVPATATARHSSARACRICRSFSRRASPTRSGCSAITASIGSIALLPTRRCGCRRGTRTPTSTTKRSTRCTPQPADTRTSSRHTARWPGTSHRAHRSPPPTSRSPRPTPRPSSRSASSAPASSVPLRPSGSTCGRWPTCVIDDESADIGTSAVADALGRNAQSLSPARDALLKKGLVYSGQRGRIAFTVPHFGRYLQQQDA